MKNQRLLSILAILFVAGCSSTSDEVPDLHPSELYHEITLDMDEADWPDAIRKLEALDSRYPFGAYSEQTQLDLIYAYYKNGDYLLALASIERFIRLKPVHENMDWALYMRGLTYEGMDRNFMHDLFDVDRAERDPEPIRKAFLDYKRLLQQFPTSQYAADAKQRMVGLKNRIARYDLASADFYLRRKAWISAINRAQELQKTFPDTQAARDSLHIQLEAYKELNMPEAVARTEELIRLNDAE